ncbi:MAG: hypothetical protein KKC29_13740 [Alphaproteobacteria bacterium]|jgi:hypothetical protein|nr:hypothetical protein [Alphaproteobacteria bacterium]MBU2040881.1 hypothetical protein [Alphaproteobacteria bacterium]MBU2125967.1 hypothetical protein [Alphaproteobacteria bacterium]MBU2207910.1 hypothetical protein [Alphaproteobacteria bacterium]MBU2292151.1 hypothetical protein [Alphaproteobacteria bacterium]
MTQAPLRRLIDLPGIDDLEMKALMKPRAADPDERHEFPEIVAAVEETARAAFGLTPDEAEAVVRPADWDGIERLEPAEMVAAFAAEGWDVADARRKPLRMLGWWALPLALAMRGVAGEVPFHAEPDQPVTDWGSNLKAEATRFRKR